MVRISTGCTVSAMIDSEDINVTYCTERLYLRCTCVLLSPNVFRTRHFAKIESKEGIETIISLVF